VGGSRGTLSSRKRGVQQTTPRTYTEGMLRHVAALVVALVFIGTLRQANSQPSPPLTPWQWQQEEVTRYFGAATAIQMGGWGQLAQRVNEIIAQLMVHSQMVFRVVPAQTFNVGQAHVGGWILLDLSTATRPRDELAFWLAHEWGHEALGHQPNYYHPAGNPWRGRMTPTADEDAADRWAGAFICAAGYDIARVTASLRRLPRVHADMAHSNGDERAQYARAGYSAQGCTLPDEDASDVVTPEIPTPQCTTTIVRCQHPAHPDGDQFPCQHPMHPSGDLIPCMHACPGPYGPVPCHVSDVVPCSHPAHMFDVAPCSHPMHVQGDRVEQCE